MYNLLRAAHLFYKYAAGIYEGYRDKIEELSKRNPYPFREWFGKDGRAYIEFQPSIGGVDENVKGLLEEYGYTITDYSAGLASKDGRILRIGKILAKIRKEKIKELDLKNQLNEVENYDKELRETNQYMNEIEIEFQASKYRVSKGQEHLIVFSQDPHDVAKMSTERSWTSCMELGKEKYKDVFCEVEDGGFIAYLITKEDRDIKKPLARILIRRFDNEQGISIAIPEKSVYGNNMPGFYEAVENWINQKQEIKYGQYDRKGGGASDTLGQTHIAAPTNKEEINQFIKNLYKIDPDWERLLKSPNLPKGLIKLLARNLYRRGSTGHIDWVEVAAYKTLSEEFIREFADKIDWIWISTSQNLSESFIREFANKFDQRNLLENLIEISKSQKLSEDFIRDFADKVDWDYISKYQTLSEDFIRDFADRVDWLAISEYQELSEDFIREFADKVNWNEISKHQKLSEPFIREFADRVRWGYISKNQKLSEPFIREFADQVDWNSISHYQNLSETFIREFASKVNWIWISIKQKLSEPFIREFADKVNWNWISIKQELSEPFIRELADKVNWDYILQNQKLSEKFKKEFAYKVN